MWQDVDELEDDLVKYEDVDVLHHEEDQDGRELEAHWGV